MLVNAQSWILKILNVSIISIIFPRNLIKYICYINNKTTFSIYFVKSFTTYLIKCNHYIFITQYSAENFWKKIIQTSNIEKSSFSSADNEDCWWMWSVWCSLTKNLLYWQSHTLFSFKSLKLWFSFPSKNKLFNRDAKYIGI